MTPPDQVTQARINALVNYLQGLFPGIMLTEGDLEVMKTVLSIYRGTKDAARYFCLMKGGTGCLGPLESVRLSYRKGDRVPAFKIPEAGDIRLAGTRASRDTTLPKNFGQIKHLFDKEAKAAERQLSRAETDLAKGKQELQGGSEEEPTPSPATTAKPRRKKEGSAEASKKGERPRRPKKAKTQEGACPPDKEKSEMKTEEKKETKPEKKEAKPEKKEAKPEKKEAPKPAKKGRGKAPKTTDIEGTINEVAGQLSLDDLGRK
jgi:hypothetical protein